jgi:hypothetical protein
MTDAQNVSEFLCLFRIIIGFATTVGVNLITVIVAPMKLATVMIDVAKSAIRFSRLKHPITLFVVIVLWRRFTPGNGKTLDGCC